MDCDAITGSQNGAIWIKPFVNQTYARRQLTHCPQSGGVLVLFYPIPPPTPQIWVRPMGTVKMLAEASIEEDINCLSWLNKSTFSLLENKRVRSSGR